MTYSAQADPAAVKVYLSEVFPPRHGGSGRWLYELASRQANGSTLAAVDHLPQGTPELVGGEAWIRRLDFSLADTGGLSPGGAWGYWNLLRRLRAAYAPHRPSRFLAARVLPEGWLAYLHSFRHAVPFACFAHGEEVNLEGCEQGGVMASRQHRWMAGRVLRAADLLIANSHSTAGMLRDQWNVPSSKVKVVTPGVDTQYFVPAARDPAARAKWGWGDSPVLLTVGRLQARKGHDRVLQALPQILQELPELKYAIVGDGEEASRLHRLAEQLGVGNAVCWHPQTSNAELLAMYQQSDLFILANRQIGADVEGFGMVLLEAAACGKPTIAGRSGGTGEALAEGTTGLLINAEEPEAIVTAVTDLLTDPERCASLGRAGRERAVAEFDWQVLARRVDQVLAECRS